MDEELRRRNEAWTAALVAGDAAPVAQEFAAQGADGPAVRWRPAESELAHEPLPFLLRFWETARGAARWPSARRIEPVALRPALGYLVLLEPLAGSADFRYRLFGSVIAHVSGFDLNGRTLEAHRASSYVVGFYAASCAAVLRRGEPLATVHRPPVAVSATTWHRLILPFGEASVTRILVGIAPVGRDGRVIGRG